MTKECCTEKSLPMTYPPITLYPYIANKLSVLMSYKETLPWYYSNFIQMWTRKIEPSTYWFDFLYARMRGFCPSYKISLFSKKIIQYKWNSIVDFIIDVIDLGFYVYMNIDTFYISAGGNYNEHHYRHDIFVYGYDKDKKMLNVADFYNAGKYAYSFAGFDEFELAYTNYYKTNQYDFYEGIFVETFESTNYNFDIKKIANTVNDFLLSRNTTIVSDYEMFDDKENTVYGIQVYDVFSEYLNRLSKRTIEGIDVRPFHMLFDHKVAMLQRLKYLGDSNYLDNTEYISDLYTLLRNECHMIRNMILKSRYTNDTKIYTEAIKKLAIISNTEKKALNALLDSLR